MVQTYPPQSYRSNRHTNYPPQGSLDGEIMPPEEKTWIDNLGNEFVDDLGEVITFAP